MALATYSDLKSAIADWLNRDDLTAVIPDFITLAEAKIARDLRHIEQEKRVTSTLDERYEVLPSDFLEMRRIYLSDGTQLKPISGTEMGELRVENDDTAGKPLYYYNTAYELEFYPTPDDSYSMTMLYYGRIPALSDSNTTNWLLTDYPDVYLYGSLAHAAPYLQHDERTALWIGMYKAAIEDLNITSKRAAYYGGSLVLRDTRNK